MSLPIMETQNAYSQVSKDRSHDIARIRGNKYPDSRNFCVLGKGSLFQISFYLRCGRGAYCDKIKSGSIKKISKYKTRRRKMKKLLSTFIVIATCAALAVPAFALTQGDSGNDVVKLQEALIEKGYLIGEADGSYGPLTEAAVKAFREANNLSADGGANGEMTDILYDNAVEPETEPAAENSEVTEETEEVKETQTYSSMIQKYESGEITKEGLNTWLQENYLYKGMLLVKYGIEALVSENGLAEVDMENLPKDLKEEDLVKEDDKYYVSIETLTGLASSRLNTTEEDYKAKVNVQEARTALSAKDPEKAALNLLIPYIDGQTEESSDEETEPNENETKLLMIAEAATTYKLTSEQIEMLSNTGIITGIKDYAIENGTDIKIADLVAVNTDIVMNISVDDTAVLYDVNGKYSVYCHVIFDMESFTAYEEENGTDFMLPDENLDFVTETILTIASEEDTKKAQEEGTTAITKTNKEEVVTEIAAAVTGNVSSAADVKQNNSSSQTGAGAQTGTINRVPATTAAKEESQTTGKQNETTQKETTTQQHTTKPSQQETTMQQQTKPAQQETTTQQQTKPSQETTTQQQTQPQTEPQTTAHTHSYEVAESVSATCDTDGYVLYKCYGCGDSYTEPVYATGHNWVEISQGWIVNRVTKVECKWCGAQFDTVDEWVIHSIDTDHGNYAWTDVEVSREPVSDDLAQTWTYVGDQCSICGAWR